VNPLPRRVEPELLDFLPTTDPAAIRSRSDLRRLNVLMRQSATLARLLGTHDAPKRMRRIIDLGGGDGAFLLQLAQRMPRRAGPIGAVLVDRHPSVSRQTREQLRALGWELEVATADVVEWLEQAPTQGSTVTIANLFLHHFADGVLRALLARIAAKSDLFVASDPRRSRFTLTASRLIGLIGGNSVTRHDGVISVRAGFIGHELSALWPDAAGWRIEESETGPFSHYFVASRRGV
jgi:Methyltransferase domain